MARYGMRKLKLIARINPATGTPIVFDFFNALVFFSGFLYPFTLLWGGFNSALEWLPYFGLLPVSASTFVYGLSYWTFELKWHSLAVFALGFFFYLLILEEELSYKSIYFSFYLTCIVAMAFCVTWGLLIFHENRTENHNSGQ